MASLEVLRATAEEFTKLFGLDPPIDVSIDREELILLLKEAITLIKPTDEFEPWMLEVIQELEGGTTPEEPDTEELIALVQDCQKIDDLKDIVNNTENFKSLRGKLSGFKFAATLRDAMLNLIDGYSPQERAERIHKKNIEDAPINKGIESEEDFEELIEFVEKGTSSEEETTTEVPKSRNPVFMKKVSEIVSKAPFNDLFQINLQTLHAVKEDMQTNGFDTAFPIVLWNDIVIDGHTRLEAARQLKFESVPVQVKDFANEKEALDYSIHNQRDRRNLTDSELLKCVELLNTSKRKTAKQLNVGVKRAEKAKVVLSDENAKKDVLSGKKSINKAATEVKKKKQILPSETKEKKKTRIEAACVVLKDFSAQIISKEELAEETDICFEDWGGKSHKGQSKAALENVLEVLIALELVKVEGDSKVILPDWSLICK